MKNPQIQLLKNDSFDLHEKQVESEIEQSLNEIISMKKQFQNLQNQFDWYYQKCQQNFKTNTICKKICVYKISYSCKKNRHKSDKLNTQIDYLSKQEYEYENTNILKEVSKQIKISSSGKDALDFSSSDSECHESNQNYDKNYENLGFQEDKLNMIKPNWKVSLRQPQFQNKIPIENIFDSNKNQELLSQNYFDQLQINHSEKKSEQNIRDQNKFIIQQQELEPNQIYQNKYHTYQEFENTAYNTHNENFAKFEKQASISKQNSTKSNKTEKSLDGNFEYLDLKFNKVTDFIARNENCGTKHIDHSQSEITQKLDVEIELDYVKYHENKFLNKDHLNESMNFKFKNRIKTKEREKGTLSKQMQEESKTQPEIQHVSSKYEQNHSEKREDTLLIEQNFVKNAFKQDGIVSKKKKIVKETIELKFPVFTPLQFNPMPKY